MGGFPPKQPTVNGFSRRRVLPPRDRAEQSLAAGPQTHTDLRMRIQGHQGFMDKILKLKLDRCLLPRGQWSVIGAKAGTLHVPLEGRAKSLSLISSLPFILLCHIMRRQLGMKNK